MTKSEFKNTLLNMKDGEKKYVTNRSRFDYDVFKLENGVYKINFYGDGYLEKTRFCNNIDAVMSSFDEERFDYKKGVII